MAVKVVTYTKGASPYSDWLSRGRPEDTCFRYATHTNETSDHFSLIPHLNMFYLYVDMDWATIEATVAFKVDLGNRTIALTGAACRTTNIWPEMMSHLDIPYGATEGGIAHFRHAMHGARDEGLRDVMRYLFGPKWKYVYGRPTFLPRSRREEGRAWEEGRVLNFEKNPTWNKAVGYYDMTRPIAATRIQAAYRGWRVRLKYRFSPHTPLGQYVIRKMMLDP